MTAVLRKCSGFVRLGIFQAYNKLRNKNKSVHMEITLTANNAAPTKWMKHDTTLFEYLVVGMCHDSEQGTRTCVHASVSRSLQADSAHVLYDLQDGVVRWMARNAQVGNQRLLASPLALALPGHRCHRGWGAYQIRMPRISAVVVSTQDEFKFLYYGNKGIDRYLTAHPKLPQFDVTDLVIAESEQSLSMAQAEARFDMV